MSVSSVGGKAPLGAVGPALWEPSPLPLECPSTSGDLGNPEPRSAQLQPPETKSGKRRTQLLPLLVTWDCRAGLPWKVLT